MGRMWSEEGEWLSHLDEKKPSAKKKAPAVKAVLSASQMRRQLEAWARNNPDNAAYDHDGNPKTPDANY